jgi:hypothetical protein
MSTVSQRVSAIRKLTPSMMWLLRFQKMPRLRLARTLMKSSVKPTSAIAATPPRITKRLIREVHRADVGDEVADEGGGEDGDAAHGGRAFLVLVLGSELVAAEDRLSAADAAEVADREAGAEDRCRHGDAGGDESAITVELLEQLEGHGAIVRSRPPLSRTSASSRDPCRR